MLKRIAIIVVLMLIFLVSFGLFMIWWLNYFPGETEKAELACDGKAPKTLKPGDTIRVLSWNIQYGASRNYHFFYDGGPDVYAEKKVVEDNLQKMLKVLKEVKPDVILWQEFDRGSNRTHMLDELKVFWRGDPQYACWSATPYHKSAFVPSPGKKFLKRVDMELGVFSKYKITHASRHALPMLKESFLRRAFNLKRAILKVELPVEGGKSLTFLNTHFSAFSFGDGTLDKQVKKLQTLALEAEKKGYTVTAGDLNLLPPGDNPERLGKAAATFYSKTHNPIAPLYKTLHPALSVEDYNKAPAKYNTYMPPKKSKADRWIDHVFVSKDIEVKKYEVLSQHHALSDHLPIVFEITLKK